MNEPRRDAVERLVIIRLETDGYKPPVAPMLHGVENKQYRAMVDNLIRQLVQFSPQVIAEGMDACLQDYQQHTWPKIGHILPYMTDAQRRLEPRPKELEAPRDDHVPEDQRADPERAAKLLRELRGGFKQTPETDTRAGAGLLRD